MPWATRACRVTGVGVVLDGNDGGLDDGQATIALPLICLLDRGRQALREADRILLQLGDAVALARIVRVQAEGRGQRTDHFIEQLAGGGVVQVGEIEHLARLQVAGRHEVLHEQDRVDDLQRVRATGDRADLGVEEAVVPVDLRLGTEPVVRQFLQRHEVGGLLRARLAAELEAFPALLDEGADQAVAGKDRLRVQIVRAPLVAARLGDERGDRAILEQQQAVAFRHNALRTVADDVGRAAGKSFHWSASTPPTAPFTACTRPMSNSL
ncbi:hypothetical protein G6F40_013741 [Rhizopus arrhizus]|nr:hypothetical protein G6F40_013741 [Rhizopus arrhizus]